MSDLISRKAAIDAVEKESQVDGAYGYMDTKSIVDLLNDLPSAQRWIPIKTRPMDEEERDEWSEKLGYDIKYDEAVIYTSQLPDDGQEVLTCSQYGTVQIDRFENDTDYGCSFEEIGDMDGIVAWMPLPEPWKGGAG